jgi:hypothetical protein
MKKTALIFTALLLVAGLTVNGQTEHDHGQKSEQQGMMQGGMMQPGMMQGMRGMMQQQQMPMQKYMMMVNRLPNMQEQLSLTSEQSKQLIDLQAAFKKQQVDYKAEQGEKRMKLESLLDNKASADEVKQQMQDCAETIYEFGSDEQNEKYDDDAKWHDAKRPGWHDAERTRWNDAKKLKRKDFNYDGWIWRTRMGIWNGMGLDHRPHHHCRNYLVHFKICKSEQHFR